MTVFNFLSPSRIRELQALKELLLEFSGSNILKVQNTENNHSHCINWLRALPAVYFWLHLR